MLIEIDLNILTILLVIIFLVGLYFGYKIGWTHHKMRKGE